MRCLAIGGAGFIGVAACKELMRRGVETIAAGRTPRPHGTFTSYRELDRSDPARLAALVEETQPDVILDLATYQPAEVAQVLAVLGGRRYVFISTGVYPDDFGARPAAESDFQPPAGEVPAEAQEYRAGKRWCEAVLARAEGLDWVAVRPPAVFGPDDPSLRIAAYIQRLEDGGPLLVPQESYQRQAGLAWVKDVGYLAALACTVAGAHGPYNVAFAGVSLEGLLEALARALGMPARLLPISFAELPDGASVYGPDPRRSAGYDLGRSRRELGFEPSALEDALAETLGWYRVRRPSHPGYAGRATELELANRLG